MKNIRVLTENFQFLEVIFSIYLNRHVFVMNSLFFYCQRSYKCIRIISGNIAVPEFNNECQDQQLLLINLTRSCLSVL